MKCPRCRLTRPESVRLCDCGYDFKTGSVEQSYLTPNANSARSHRKIFWAIIAYGITLPYLVGISVKIYLQINGKPTVPVGGAFMLLLPFSIWFAIPFVGLAFLAQRLLSTPYFFHTGYLERLIIILVGLISGTIGTVKTFIWMFWDFEYVGFFVVGLLFPFSPWFLCALRTLAFHAIYIIIGLFVGSIIAAVFVLVRRKKSDAV